MDRSLELRAGLDSARDSITRLINMQGAKPVSRASDLVKDLSRSEIDGYSIIRAISGAITKDFQKSGLERSISEALETGLKLQRRSPESFFFPTHLPFKVPGAPVSRFIDPRYAQSRAIYQVGTGSQGGNLVGTELMAASFIEVLRNQTVTGQLGARFLSGLTENIDLPRQNAQTQTYWVGESTALTESEATFDKVSLRPHVVGALSKMSRLSMQQTTPAIEQLVREDLLQTSALAIDQAALFGTGSSNQPTGIINTSGVGQVIGGTNGANLTFDMMVQLYVAPLVGNAPMQNLGYALNGKSKGYLATLKSSTGQYLWNPTQSMAGQTPTDILGYKYAVSNQLPSNLSKGIGSTSAPYNAGTAYTPVQCVSSGGIIYECVANTTGNAPPNATYWVVAPGSIGNCSAVIFGNWQELLIGEWGVTEIMVNPYDASGFANGDILIRSFQTVDVGLRHPASFATLTDGLTPGF